MTEEIPMANDSDNGGKFHTGLYECGGVFEACCCTDCVLDSIKSTIPLDSHRFHPCEPDACYSQCLLRDRIKGRYGIKEADGACTRCLAGTFCCACNVAQILREMKYFGERPNTTCTTGDMSAMHNVAQRNEKVMNAIRPPDTSMFKPVYVDGDIPGVKVLVGANDPRHPNSPQQTAIRAQQQATQNGTQQSPPQPGMMGGGPQPQFQQQQPQQYQQQQPQQFQQPQQSQYGQGA